MGLTSAQVTERVARGQVNDVPARSSRSTAAIVRANVFTRFNAIIGTLFAIVLVVGPIQDGLFGLVVIANTGIGILQELRAKKTLDALAVIGQARPVVRRDGAPVTVPVSRIVLDDVIELGSGDKCVVDGTVAHADGLEIDESLLTGEPDPVSKHPGDAILSGSFVVAGSGAYTATRVGRHAYAAQLAEEAGRFTLVRSELRSGISRILAYVTWMMIPVAVALIIGQLYLYHHDWRQAVRRMVGGIVPMVPEGLILLTSVAFAIGVIRLGRRKCLVQELPAIEGLARVDTVCLDKTGTLTQGGMRVTDLIPLDGADAARPGPALACLAAADPRPNASLQAILDAYGHQRDGWNCAASLPFSSARKYSAAVLDDPDGRRSTWLLGAPDVLLPTGDPHLAAADALAARGLRVLLLAQTTKGLDDPALARHDTPAALIVLDQQVRSDAAAALRYFADEGVTAKVISGDSALATGAIAARLRLPHAEHPLDARRLPADTARMAEAVEKATVFGRVTPRQKRDMVEALQSRGHTVAMTGDGVNDVLALKDADIGVAMGTGSDATRAVAQIVLLGNDFTALPAVVAEGRRVIGNITRVANLFLTKTVYAVLIGLLVVIWRVPYPFLPRHSTLLSTLTIGVPAFFLALAPNTERARPHFVRTVMRFALPSGIIAGTATFATYLIARHHYRGTTATAAATSAATLTLFLISLWVLAIIARPYTRWRAILVAAMAVAFAAVLVVPWLQHFFALRLVGFELPWTAAGIAVLAAAALEVAWRRTRRAGSQGAREK
ncbi:HAD-IC family P-type ATPase [Actinoallomurus rhizosphaericola]|uniref:HAD-IC family P-type ATPase n=1 Tax=Actinoallomurus rhizosphaericola TaxID=2952536 RepID=UPI00209369CB|nr:HAD-IC family P-type ATPase [Actinoallomurus rhizosphaericola]MCO5996879.1 HAD-IC family P-type ATPase [Actinoallomurus rhizosphaericola]